MYIEFEVKFYINLKDFYQFLQKKNVQCLKKKVLMSRVVFEVPGARNSQVRVRDEGNEIRLSYKLYDNSKAIDCQKEVDVLVDDFDKTCEILTLLGLKKVRYVQNYRETFKFDDCLLMVDQWPGLQPFIEIEGNSKEAVELVIDRLGFSINNAMYGPTSLLYQQSYKLSREQFEKIETLTFENFSEVLKRIDL